LIIAGSSARAVADELPSVAKKSAGLERRDGLVPTYLDRRRGRPWLELRAESEASGVVGRFL
jgi:hypothetical protein